MPFMVMSRIIARYRKAKEVKETTTLNEASIVVHNTINCMS